MNAGELSQQMLGAVQSLRASQSELDQQARNFAQAERAYRVHKAIAYLRSEGRNVAEREANAEGVVYLNKSLSDVRYDRDLAEGLKLSALEAVRSHRGVLSALQSLSALERSEAELAKYAPQGVGA